MIRFLICNYLIIDTIAILFLFLGFEQPETCREEDVTRIDRYSVRQHDVVSVLETIDEGYCRIKEYVGILAFLLEVCNDF